MAVDSMVSGGCIISGAHIKHSLLFSSVTVEPKSIIKDCIIFPDVQIGKNCNIKNTIIDKGCIIADNTVIGFDDKNDSSLYHKSTLNRILVTPEMLGQHIHHVR